ncbi:hypothetical protein NBRC116188_27010 [Oceaniserpentilla sp. 4NH20-0058]|uniref:sensor histidine kinase n=1 Tax=Oceaniserpentilla sp. 4NH20-0058 TaxID=3127660 RepID=UPI00310704A1
MSDAYQSAYEREKKARFAAEKLLDEKTREVQSSIDMIQHQFNDLMQQKKESDYLLAVARLTQSDESLTQVVQKYTQESMQFLDARFSRYSFIKGGKIKLSNPIGLNERLVPLHSEAHKSIYNDHDRTTLKIRDLNQPDLLDICQQHGVDRVVLLPIKSFGKVTTVCELYLSSETEFKSNVIDQCQVAGYQISGMLERNANNKKLEESFSEIKSSHDKLKQAQAQLVQSEKMASLGQLAAGVAHEINNPIGFVMSNLGTLREYTDVMSDYFSLSCQLVASLDSEQAQKMKAIDEEQDLNFIFGDIGNIMNDCDEGLRRVKEIVSNLKSFARSDEEESTEFNLNLCIDNIIKVVWNELKYKVTLHKQFDEDLPLIKGHEGQIGQVVMNMLVNASQAMEEEGDIYISTEKQAKTIRLVIRDTAKGMPSSVIEKIFDPFFTTKGVSEGTGLGLSISYGIIESHGGSIKVDSREGEGTTFTIELPC